MPQTNPLSPAQRWILFIALSLGTFMMVLDYSIANVSIPYIAGDLAVSNEEGLYVITTFAVGNAIGLIMTGWLTKRFGEIRTMTISLILFSLFSLFCGLSFSLAMLVANRFLQGLVAGPIVPLSQSLIHKYSSPETLNRDISIWSTIVITAPVLGPVLGGYISDWYHWPWIFYINIPIGVFCIAAIWTIMKKYESKTEKVPIDIAGLILLSIGVTSLQILLDKGQQWDWLLSDRIWVLLVGTVVGFVYLFLWEKIAEKPFIDLKLFKIPSFSLSIVCLIFSYAMYFGSVVVVPLWLQEYMTYNATWAGIAVCSIGVAPLLFSLATPKIIEKFGLVRTLMLSFFFFGAGCFYSSFFTVQVDLLHISIARFIFGFGFVCYVAPLFAISTKGLPLERLPAATGLFHFVRSMMGGVGTSVFTTIWIRRTYFHHERVGETLTIYNPMVPSEVGKQSLTILNNSLDQQAALLAINDVFYLMTWLFLGLIVLLFFWTIIRRKQMGASKAPIHAPIE